MTTVIIDELRVDVLDQEDFLSDLRWFLEKTTISSWFCLRDDDEQEAKEGEGVGDEDDWV